MSAPSGGFMLWWISVAVAIIGLSFVALLWIGHQMERLTHPERL